MARITFGAIATEIRGSMGGTTFQSNRYGFTAKNKGMCSKSYSPAQALYRGYFKQLSSAWSNLTDTQKSGYNAYALSNPQYPANSSTRAYSGYDLFRAYNLPRVQASFDILTDIDPHQIAFIALTPFFELSNGVLTFTPVFDPGLVNQIAFYYISSKLNRTDIGQFNEYRRVPVACDVSSTFDITLWYTNMFGRLPVVNDHITLLYSNCKAYEPQIGGILSTTARVS